MNLVFVVEKKNVLCVKTFCNIIGKKTNNESNSNAENLCSQQSFLFCYIRNTLAKKNELSTMTAKF